MVRSTKQSPMEVIRFVLFECDLDRVFLSIAAADPFDYFDLWVLFKRA